MKSKLAPHILRAQSGIQEHLNSGPVALKLVGDWASFQVRPGSLIIGRRHADGDFQLIDKFKAGRTAEGSAEQFVDLQRDTYLSNPHIKYWEGPNEPVLWGDDIDDAAAMAWYARFESRRMVLMDRMGLRCCIGNFATGCPPLHLWPHFLSAIQDGLLYKAILGVHEYAHPWIWWMTGGYQLNPTENEGDEGWGTLRYRKVYRQHLLPAGLQIPLAITEFGIDALSNPKPPHTPNVQWKGLGSFWSNNHEGPIPYPGGRDRYYADQLIWYDQQIQEDEYVIAAFIYTVGSWPGVWREMDIADTAVLGYISDHIEANPPKAFDYYSYTRKGEDMKRVDYEVTVRVPLPNSESYARAIEDAKKEWNSVVPSLHDARRLTSVICPSGETGLALIYDITTQQRRQEILDFFAEMEPTARIKFVGLGLDNGDDEEPPELVDVTSKYIDNASFEKHWTRDTHTGQEFGEIYTPASFRWFWREGGEFRRPEALVIQKVPPFLEPPRIAHGQKSVKAFTMHGRMWAGLYQTISGLEPGATYRLTAQAHAWSAHTGALGVEGPHCSTGVGCGPVYIPEDEIPPLAKLPDNLEMMPPEERNKIRTEAALNDAIGNFVFRMGTSSEPNPFGDNVDWGPGAAIYNSFDWVPEHEFVAPASGEITIFLLAESKWAFRTSDAYWDNIRLYKASPGPKLELIDLTDELVTNPDSRWYPYRTRSINEDGKIEQAIWAVVHHTAGPQLGSDRAVDHIKSIARSHALGDRGYPGIAYCVMIDADGQGYLVNKPETVSFAHGRQGSGRDENLLGIPICLLGDFRFGNAPTERQMETLHSVIEWLDKITVNDLGVIGHKDLSPTECPGDQWPWLPGWGLDPKPPPVTNLLVGLHDKPGGEWLAGKGCCLALAQVQRHGRSLDLRGLSEATIVRVDWGYADGTGSLPTPDEADAWVNAVVNTINSSKGVGGWTIGNEVNNPIEWRNYPNPTFIVSPEYYIELYNRIASRVVAPLAPFAIDPYNVVAGRFGQPNDPKVWAERIYAGISRYDFVTLHAKTQGNSPAECTSPAEFTHAPLIGRKLYLMTVEDQLEWIPRERPVYVKELNPQRRNDGSLGWEPGNSEWVHESLRYMRTQPVKGVMFYRFELAGGGQEGFALVNKPDILNAIRQQLRG